MIGTKIGKGLKIFLKYADETNISKKIEYLEEMIELSGNKEHKQRLIELREKYRNEIK